MDPNYLAAINMHPRMLIGQKVPSLREGGGEDVIRDSADAKDWQDAAKTLLKQEVAGRVKTKIDNARPMLSVIQESILLFQNNSDLVPGTAEFDPELAKAFTDIASDYELRINGDLYGYEVNVQPLINKLRTQLATSRGAAGAQQQGQPTPRQQQVAQQPRTDGGQFDAPQAGIPPKAGSGGGSSEDDFTTFWQSVGFQPGGMTI